MKCQASWSIWQGCVIFADNFPVPSTIAPNALKESLGFQLWNTTFDRVGFFYERFGGVFMSHFS